MSIKSMKIHNSEFDIDVVMRSGQCFSINKVVDEVNGEFYIVLSGDNCCKVIRDDLYSTFYYNDCAEKYWLSYIGDFKMYSGYVSNIMYSGYKFLSESAKYSRGLVILNQDIWEMIVSFIISQRKSIPAIRTSLNRLRDKYGYERDFMGIKYKTFPTAHDMMDLKVEDLSDCGMGYRAKYVIEAIKWWNSLNSNKLSILRDCGRYDEHMSVLKEIKGVGDKVANCICLFALGDIDAFPIDVWIQRVLDKNLISSDVSEFDGYKGFLQQVIFFYVINHKDLFKE